MKAVAAHPVGDHRAHPKGEVAMPKGIVGGYAASKFGKPVAAVPLGQPEKVFVDGVVEGDLAGLYITADVLIPRAESCLKGLGGHRIAVFIGDVAEIEIGPGDRAELGDTRELVFAELVVLLHEHSGAQDKKRGGWNMTQDGLAGLPTRCLAQGLRGVGVVEDCGGKHALFLETGVIERETEGELLRYA